MSLVLAGVAKGVVTGVAVGVGLGVMACLRLRRPKPESSAGYWQELGRLWSGVDKYILQGSSGVGQCAGVLSALVTHMESESARVSAQREESVGEYKKCLTQLDKANSHAKLLRQRSQECADRAHWIELSGVLRELAPRESPECVPHLAAGSAEHSDGSVPGVHVLESARTRRSAGGGEESVRSSPPAGWGVAPAPHEVVHEVGLRALQPLRESPGARIRVHSKCGRVLERGEEASRTGVGSEGAGVPPEVD